ncbi:hypothetical protein BC826DRAFT_1004295 [Russula brevipes]|nr:hypothetical protein BC826DRAFT_1004295 [Russula brevipes]
MIFPSLRLLEFRGVCAYLEGLVGRICAPRLERFHITLFYEPTFTLGHLSEFIKATEGIRGPVVSVTFRNEGVAAFAITSRGDSTPSPLYLEFRCNQFDWQVFSMTQVCDVLVPVLSFSELSLQNSRVLQTLRLRSLGDPHRPSDGENAVDSTMWYELLRPFNGVKRLDVWGHHLAVELSCALDADDAGLIPWLLPELQELTYPRVETAFAAFVNARQSVGRPVNLLPWSEIVSAYGHIRPDSLSSTGSSQ